MSIALKEMLEALTRMQIDIIINDNRSSMISILERKRKYARLSVHRMFLEASNQEVIALADLIKNKRGKDHHRILRAYIDEASSKYEKDISIDESKLQTQGKFYNLSVHYDQVNAEYFDSTLSLHITWFGKENHIPRSQMTFGLYQDAQKLIKIHRLLDHQSVPSYFLEYIIYHEMLHDIYRPEVNAKGARKIHTEAFKKKEKEFKQYLSAKIWEKGFKKRMFR